MGKPIETCLKEKEDYFLLWYAYVAHICIWNIDVSVKERFIFDNKQSQLYTYYTYFAHTDNHKQL